MRSWKRTVLVAGIVCAVALAEQAYAQKVMRGSRRTPGPCAPPPPPKRQAIASAEGKPPSANGGGRLKALPCAPTRRTEKKSPPAPPTLIAKISFGDNSNWQTDKNDVFNLLRQVKKQLKIEYRPTVTEFSHFSFDPNQVPILYFTGHYPFRFSKPELAKIRKFLGNGGTMIMDACCGSEEFYEAANEQCRKILPGSDLRRLPLDHPVFWCYHTIDRVKYSDLVTDRLEGKPYLEGVDIGCRTAIFVSRYDLSCGWDGHTHPWSRQYVKNDAIRLGMNMMIYAASARQHYQGLADCRVYQEQDKTARGKVVLAQVKLPGEQLRNLSAVSNLMAQLSSQMPAKVQFAKVSVALEDPAIFRYPLLYLSGHHDFKLTDIQLANLRKYLRGGGFLVSEACCGRIAFDRAFRREMARVFPGRQLARLTAEHPVYSMPEPLGEIGVSPALALRLEGKPGPRLEGVGLGKATAVVYSRYGLSCGWQEAMPPFALAYGPDTALRLGVRILTYGISH